jgi:hypothetical protein
MQLVLGGINIRQPFRQAKAIWRVWLGGLLVYPPTAKRQSEHGGFIPANP